MAQYNYEIIGNFTGSSRTSNLSLGTVIIDDNELSGGGRDEYLMGLAKSSFGGKIAKEENRITGTLTKVRANRKELVDKNSSKSASRKLTPSVNKSKLIKRLLRLVLIIGVWWFYVMKEMLISAYWNSPKKSFAWYRNFIKG